MYIVIFRGTKFLESKLYLQGRHLTEINCYCEAKLKKKTESWFLCVSEMITLKENVLLTPFVYLLLNCILSIKIILNAILLHDRRTNFKDALLFSAPSKMYLAVQSFFQYIPSFRTNSYNPEQTNFVTLLERLLQFQLLDQQSSWRQFSFNASMMSLYLIVGKFSTIAVIEKSLCDSQFDNCMLFYLSSQ